MITRGEIRLNCCESVLTRIDERHPLPGFGQSIMRIASNFGGGVGGWQSVCGAVSGAAMALGLLYGTEGDEAPEEFEEKRRRMREVTKGFMRAFEEHFGHVDCLGLLGVDFRTEEGKMRYEAMKERGETRCGEYVEWASEEVLEMIDPL